MAVRLEFQTTDSQEIELAQRYWAMDEEGAYLERVADLLPFRGITQPGLVAKFVREICQAYDQNHICPSCDGQMRVNARADAKKAFQESYYPCDDCKEIEQEQAQHREALERAQLKERLAPYIASVREKTLRYSELPDDVVIALQALYALLGPRLSQGTFARHECEQLTPHGSAGLIDRLYKAGVLADDPTAAKPGTYSFEDGKLWFKHATVRYFLPPDKDAGCSQESLNALLDRTFSDSAALTSLWLDYAVADVMRYLDIQCDVHNQMLDDEAVEKIKGSVRHGLRRYSVAQLWCIMWKVTRDAAALASRSYYNRDTATATIPTKVRKQLELADQGSEPRNEWTRPELHIAGSLGMVFNNLFGLDEYSKGDEVLRLFARLGEKRSSQVELHQLAKGFMEAALGAQCALPALEAFAEMVRAGLTAEDALNEAIQRNPELFS